MAQKVANRELVTRQKAIATTDDLATAGKLTDEQADRFIDYVVDISGLKDNVRVARFSAETMNIQKIGVGTRVAMPAAEAVSPSVRRGVTTSKVPLTPVEIIVPFEIGDSFTEINLEGEDVEDHIVRMMAAQTANDLETLYINGDSVGPSIAEGDYIDGGHATDHVLDSYLALTDGWLKLARASNPVDWAGANIGASLFGQMLRSLPAKFKRDRSKLRFICSLELEQLYREVIASRHTTMGDSAISGTQAITPFGVPLVPFPLFDWQPQIVEHATMTGTTAQQLLYAPIVEDSETVVPSTIGTTPTTPYVEGVNYTMDYTNGTITRIAVAGIGDGDVVKVTYQASPQLLLTHFMNLVLGIGRDIRIERDRDIYRRTNQYAITVKVAVEFEEDTAIVFAKNIGSTI